ncbi:MAG: hypothetical protein JWL84_3922 [Rhodospirillales bacterium]|nr:hypothetical protein [Rhodospirillales bacterium]
MLACAISPTAPAASDGSTVRHHLSAPLVALVLTGCQLSSVEQQTNALTLGPQSTAQHQREMRRYDTRDENSILSASSAVLQDLGFTIEETNAGGGLVVGAKDRDAVEAGEVAGQIFLAAVIAAMGGKSDPTWDKVQKIRISIVTKPSSDKSAVIVRVNFQRLVWNTKNQISRAETINDPVIDQQFFDKLSQAVFLEGHQI